MLADELMVSGSMGYASKLMDKVRTNIRASQKFVLDAPFAAAADALSSDYGSLVKAFPFCRLPFAQTWFEVAQSDRPNFIAAGIHAPDFQSRPRRVGFLCSATRDDLSAWKAHLFWVLPMVVQQWNAAALAMEFDMTQLTTTIYSDNPRPLGKDHEEFFPNSGMKVH